MPWVPEVFSRVRRGTLCGRRHERRAAKLSFNRFFSTSTFIFRSKFILMYPYRHICQSKYLFGPISWNSGSNTGALFYLSPPPSGKPSVTCPRHGPKILCMNIQHGHEILTGVVCFKYVPFFTRFGFLNLVV